MGFINKQSPCYLLNKLSLVFLLLVFVLVPKIRAVGPIEDKDDYGIPLPEGQTKAGSIAGTMAGTGLKGPSSLDSNSGVISAGTMAGGSLAGGPAAGGPAAGGPAALPGIGQIGVDKAMGGPLLGDKQLPGPFGGGKPDAGPTPGSTVPVAPNKRVPAVMVFGDSTSDPGNNNFISTSFKANFPPYGKDFANRVATGRFTNGFLSNDFLARSLGVKESIPAYLDPSLTIEQLSTGVSFASAGSGFDPLTPAMSHVISLQQQLVYFREYKKRLEAGIGPEKTKDVISNAFYMVSASTNDFIVNYYAVPIRRKNYDVPAYTEFLMTQIHRFIEDLLAEGARKIGFPGMTPIGCLPFVITFYSKNPMTDRACIESLSSVARDFNVRLKKELDTLQANHSKDGTKIGFIESYSLMQDIYTNPKKFGFEVIDRGCCGFGLIEAAYICNRGSVTCPNTSTYAFWDSIHPTESVYILIAKSFQPTIDSIVGG